MSRVKRGINTHKRHAAVLERAKGFRTGRSKLFRRANEALLKAGAYAYRDRRTKKRDLRASWIVRINAAVRAEGMTYSSFMAAMRKNGIELNRRVLSEMALNDSAALQSLVAKVAGKK